MRIKLLTAAIAIAIAALTALPTLAAAEGGPTIRWWEFEEPVLELPQELEATTENSSFLFDTSENKPYFPADGFVFCPTHEFTGNLESNEGPTTMTIDEMLFEGTETPGSKSCNTTIPSPFGKGNIRALITNNSASGWEHEWLTNGTGEFTQLVEFDVLYSAQILNMGWTFFAGCTYSKAGVETTYEEAPQPLLLTIPSQVMEVGGTSGGYCPPVNIEGSFELTDHFNRFSITNP